MSGESNRYAKHNRSGGMSSILSSLEPIDKPFVEKMNEDHISQVITYSDQRDQRSFQSEQTERKMRLAYFVIACVVVVSLFVFLTVYLADRDKVLYRDIMTLVVGLAGGSLFGYGLGLRKNRKDLKR